MQRETDEPQISQEKICKNHLQPSRLRSIRVISVPICIRIGAGAPPLDCFENKLLLTLRRICEQPLVTVAPPGGMIRLGAMDMRSGLQVAGQLTQASLLPTLCSLPPTMNQGSRCANNSLIPRHVLNCAFSRASFCQCALPFVSTALSFSQTDHRHLCAKSVGKA